MREIRLSKHIFGDLSVRARNLLGVYGPNRMDKRPLSNAEIVEMLKHPVGTPTLAELAKNCRSALIVTDDNTRMTPLSRILPPSLNEMEQAEIPPERISILIGLGTHRPMTKDEIIDKFGWQISHKYRIVNHAWNNPDELISVGDCDLGFEVVINRLVQNADFILSVGNIIPHATAGFSGGGKTIIPGICAEKTIEQTHWAALDYSMADILGNPENKVREAIISVCRKIGLDMIVNAVLCNGGEIYDLVIGDVDLAHKKGIEKSKEVYGVCVPGKADIVIAEAYPTDIDLRQAIKAICTADLVCDDGGVVILPAECVEGIAPQFPEFVKYGFRDPEALFQDVVSGKFKQKLMAYTLVAIGRIVSKRLKAILVSPNIDALQADKLGFLWAPDLQASVEMAFKLTHFDAKLMVLKQAGEILPLLN